MSETLEENKTQDIFSHPCISYLGFTNGSELNYFSTIAKLLDLCFWLADYYQRQSVVWLFKFEIFIFQLYSQAASNTPYIQISFLEASLSNQTWAKCLFDLTFRYVCESTILIGMLSVENHSYIIHVSPNSSSYESLNSRQKTSLACRHTTMMAKKIDVQLKVEAQ